MRWDDLFGDLEQQWDAQQALELDAEVAERVRHERGLVALVDRLRGAVGSPLTLTVRGLTAPVGLRLQKVGPDWLLGTDPGGRQVVVARQALTSVLGLPVTTAQPDASVTGRAMDLRFVVRGLARDRAQVQVALVDGSTASGVVDRVGADFCEVAESADVRRRGEVRAVRTVPLSALATVRTS